MQGGIYALRHFRSVERAVKEAINVAALVCSRKEVVELPHINDRAVIAKVFITDVGFCHCIDLCVCYQQQWNVALNLLGQGLIDPHFPRVAKYHINTESDSSFRKNNFLTSDLSNADRVDLSCTSS